jgi:exonuclease III
MENINRLFKFMKYAKIYNETGEDNAKKAAEDTCCYFGSNENYSNINIICWNYDCKRQNEKLFNEKINLLQEINPDILILQECAYYECILLKKYFEYVNWYGDGKDSIYGIGILSNKYKHNQINCNLFEQKFRYIVPYEIKINEVNILLLSVWTKGVLYYKSKNGDIYDDFHNLSYTQNIIDAIDYYDELIKKYSEVIILGDFNSFDKKLNRKKWQIEIENKLKKYEIYNCTLFPNYKPLGDQHFETEITYYDNYQPNNAGTNDYCFLKNSENLNLNRFGIGKPDEWIKYSDHFPLFIDLSVKKPNFA